MTATITPATETISEIARTSAQLTGKRVAMVMYSSYPEDERPRRVIDAFRKEGMTIELICLGEGNAKSQENTEGLEILHVPLRHRRGGKLAYAFQYGSFLLISTLVLAWRSLLRRYDLVYVHNMPDVLVISALVPKALGAKVILDLHDPMPELMTTIFGLNKESRTVRFIRWMEKWSIARVDLAITVNQACKHLFTSRSCATDKMIVVMNTPDSVIFPFHDVTEQPSPDPFSNKRFVMMYHGTAVERNGLDIAVEALALAKDKMPDAELRVYGPSTPFLESVMCTVREKHLEGLVHYLGPKTLEELVNEIEQCDLGLVPNRRSSFTEINTPVRIFDFMALGKPVIVPLTPGIRDYFAEDSLLFFEAGNAADLARQMEHTFSNRQKLNEIVRKGQQVYLAHTWAQEKQTLLEGVSSLLR